VLIWPAVRCALSARFHEEEAVFLAPFSSDQPARAAGAAVARRADSRQAGAHPERRCRAFAAKSLHCKAKAPSKRKALSNHRSALGRTLGGRRFSASTPLTQPYSNLYQPHQHFRVELGK
jgi:hypothetical protein